MGTYLYADQVSSITNTNGGQTGSQRYYPYGDQRGSASVYPPYRYTGQRWEETLGLYFYNARWYDPTLGRFIQPDSIVPEPGNPQALNRYSYVLNNPVKYTDSSGHEPTAYEDRRMPFMGESQWIKNLRTDYSAWASQHHGSGSGGAWTTEDWRGFGLVRQTLGTELLEQNHRHFTLRSPEGPGIYLTAWTGGTFRFDLTPEGTAVGVGGFVWGDAGAWVLGDTIMILEEYRDIKPSNIGEDGRRMKSMLNHEWTHVLQYRNDSMNGFVQTYVPQRVWAGFICWLYPDMDMWGIIPYEQTGITVQELYNRYPNLPNIWEFPNE